SGSTIASSSTLLSRLSIIIWLRSLCPSSEPPTPRATMRWKCSETPVGANSIISVSTVGLPGGTRKPSLARQPIIAGSLSCSRRELRARRRARDRHLLRGHVRRHVGEKRGAEIALAGIGQHAQHGRALRRLGAHPE